MSDEEQQDVLQAYCERTREDAPDAGDGGSEDGGSESSSSEEEGYSTKHDQVRCSAGSACTDPCASIAARAISIARSFPARKAAETVKAARRVAAMGMKKVRGDGWVLLCVSSCR